MLFKIILTFAFLSGIYGLANHRRIPRSILWFSVYLFAAGAIQATAYLLAVKMGSNTQFYYVATFVYLFLFFKIFRHFSTDRAYRKRTAIWFAFAALILGIMVVPILIENDHQRRLQQEVILLYNLFIAGASLHALLLMLKHPTTQKPTRQGLFWMVSAIFFYHVAVSAFWAMSKYLSLSGQTEFAKVIGYTNLVLILVFYALGAVSIFVAIRERATHERIGQ